VDVDFNRAMRLVLAALTPQERGEGVVHMTTAPAGPGAVIAPRTELPLERPSYVAFVDAEPSANWGHPARYLIVDPGSEEVRSHDARFPPFGAGSAEWRVVHRGSSAAEPPT
jgi:hypothetical protein